ncbi:acyltransferase [Undibacterium sp. 14-3-2]|uniref:acyltransferase family protein n=1 Tax=Undibacterium sp. 14-3-2 TaxID=2800129 RepID=UPI001903DEEA|nr:acyltransferase [Undibacterium sp. 14-3-2]MBK1890609.1 acyltransferase [Undibacterium sp. 14-3-2]MBY0571871.1 acyltransferase [Burkholderiaceae bacterium]
MQNRDHWVDYAKGLGILLVVYGHVSRGVFNAGVKVDAELFKLVDSVIYSFHMPLFFFLSGLFFLPSLQKYGRTGLIADKVDSVLYPYILWSLLQGFIEVFLSGYTTSSTTTGEVLSLFWQPRAQFWFLYVLFAIFVLMAMLYRERQSLPEWALPLTALAAWFLQMFVQLPFPLDFIGSYLIFFVLGMSALRWKDILQTHALTATLCAVAIFTGLEYLFHAQLHLVYTDKSVLNLALAIAGIALICSAAVLLAQWNQQWMTWLATLGYCSMPIYLMHILTGSGVRIVLSKLLHIQSAAAHLIIGSLAGLLIPLAVYQLSKNAGLHGLRYLFMPPAGLSLKARLAWK